MRIDQPDQGNNLFLSFPNQDPAVFGQLFDRYNKSLYYFAQNLVQNPEEAEDIVQDTFKKLWESRTSFTGPDHLEGFLFLVTRNAALNYLRNRKNRKSSHKAFPFFPIDDNNALDAMEDEARLLGRIAQEVERLSTERKAVFKLYFYEQMTTSEIAAKLGRSEQTVLNQKNDALKQLRKGLPPSAYLLVCLVIFYYKSMN
jgi:RNA polymerase sigma-70 factor (family 1)